MNPNSRLEAFCDGVFAIAITLLVIDIKIPSTVNIRNNTEFWLALKHILPSVFAFILSFTIILITWVNHHNSLKLVNRSSATYNYANGFLLLTVAFIPFPTSLLGEYILTGHSAPAVILYNSTLALQSVGWILITGTALKSHMEKSEKARKAIRKSGRFGYFAFVLYTLCAIAAIWFPLTIVILTTITWVFWLVFGMNIRHEEMN